MSQAKVDRYKEEKKNRKKIMDYDELVQKNIAGEISDLEFLLAQEELAQAYQEEMAAKQQETNNQTAREWLLDYENRNLYQ